MRRRALSSLKELDAFPKVSESYVETSASGGTGWACDHCYQPARQQSHYSHSLKLIFLLHSVPDSLRLHGPSGCFRIFCVSGHLDEV